MNDISRNKRVRTLVKSFNAQRKKQAAQIDILCNDFIAAQREFLGSLHSLSFTADFYESILAASDPDDIFHLAAEQIKGQLGEPNVAVFLRNGDSFELRMFQSERDGLLRDYPLETCFNIETVNQVCTSNRICSLEAMLEMGLPAGPKLAEKLSAFAVPFGTPGASMGFILLYRSIDVPVTAEQLKYVSAITTGFAAAISAHRLSPNTAP